MKVSLITVSYNSEKTIKETFESVRLQNQDGFTIEYIHIDGLSTDSTVNISYDYDEIIDIRVSEKDLGIYNAMNKGIDLATGDIVGFLNSDDTFSSNDILEKVVCSFKQDETLDIVYGDIDYVDLQGKIKRKWRCGDRQSFANGWHPAHPGFYAKKELFEKHGGFDEELFIAADFDLMLRFLEVFNTNSKYINSVFVNMKQGGESNRNLKNIWTGNAQIIKSFQKYSIRPQMFYTYRRFFSKILQSLI